VLLAGGLQGHDALAQAAIENVEPHIDLEATLAPQDEKANQPRAFDPLAACINVRLQGSSAAANDKIFEDAPVKDGGWQGLARLLEALTPDIDTSIPLTPSQITGRISGMLDQGQNEAALEAIEKRIAQRQDNREIGTDVQLMFLHGRALAALGRHDEAERVYLDMTTRYPELPEPWNNLAAEYVKQGKLEMARDALQMALLANPGYGDAQANMGQIELLLAQQSFNRAARLGVGEAGAKAQQTQSILQPDASTRNP
jgi:tetratricopeptide (TPR) repeat protein